MKKTLISKIPDNLPLNIEKICCGKRIFDSSCSPEARVYFIDREGGIFLKCAQKGTLKREATMTDYFHKKGLGAEVIDYISAEQDFMLTRAVVGEDCTYKDYLNNPKRLCDIMAERLRMLHELDVSDCPIQDRMSEYISLSESNYLSGNYDKSHFPDSFGYSSGEEAYKSFSKGKGLLKNEVLIHGDYCLPNIMLNDWGFSGFIDLGNAGIGDRHIDLFWGRWTLQFNLGTDEFGNRFFDSYGRDKINEDILKTIAAAEVFG